ncbi:MAG: amidase domain-containing protein [Candidatus Bipolaricaulota bacterium]|nr:amidase domain-containing protein [Candidatus Bipolaricaulota bacterium]
MTRTPSGSRRKGLIQRLLAVSLLLVLIAVLFVCVDAQASYNRLSAFQYAQKYWNKVCSDGYFFADSETPSLLGAREPAPTDEEGFDCAHFVSCCIGSEQNEPGGGLEVPSRTLTYGEPGAQRLVNWLIEQGATRVSKISAMVPGDVVAYDVDRNGWIEHVALYMGDGLVTAHSISRYSKWNPKPEADIILLHVPGPYAPPPVKLDLGWIGWVVTAIVLAGLLGVIFAGTYH